MLLKEYTVRITRPGCNNSFESLNAEAHLAQDVGEVLPYLNAVLGGTQYFADPPQVLFQASGKLIKVGAREILVNALATEEEAHKILAWLKNEINETWENRGTITPKFTGRESPKLMEILKLLPKTNCRACGQPTCMVFATRVREGVQGPDDCPDLNPSDRKALEEYLAGFEFDD